MMLTKVGPNRYRLEKQGDMLVEGQVFLSDALREQLGDDDSLKQLRDVACLPGVFKHVLGMPDMHSGFGMPIGGVFAADAHTGVVSAGAVGMDINCGVRLLATDVPAASLSTKALRQLMLSFESRIPTGIGKKTQYAEFRGNALQDIFVQGAKTVVDKGYGMRADLAVTEEEGQMPGADPEALTKTAHKRAEQLGTLGGGNHFIEFCAVSQIMDEEVAKTFSLRGGALVILIHSGSRGLGHQTCTDFSRLMLEAAPRYGLRLPSKGLAAVPIKSPEGERYLAAMSCAVNYAFANRQLMAHAAREALSEVIGTKSNEVRQVYDVAHNIAKFEMHFGQKVLVHRKGATRALPPGHPQNPLQYQSTGHPALLPGDMARGSYVVVGTPLLDETFFSVNHGAGRKMSRSEARRKISEAELRDNLGTVLVNARNLKAVVDEAPAAYKDIDEVTGVLAELGMTRLVARFKPLAVIKGEDDE